MRKYNIRDVTYTQLHVASMGPHESACGNQMSLHVWLIRVYVASMGPHESACGNQSTMQRCHKCSMASMGPHESACGNEVSHQTVNGKVIASMGPHESACGNLCHQCHKRLTSISLQWGRMNLHAEIQFSYVANLYTWNCFNGAA